MNSRKISPNNPVRRRLFPPTDDNEEGRNDNFSNSQREQTDRESEQKANKWHFDFVNDRPLPGSGKVKWYGKNENGQWIGEIQETDGQIDNTQDGTDNEDAINNVRDECAVGNEINENGFRGNAPDNDLMEDALSEIISDDLGNNRIRENEYSEAIVINNEQVTPVKDGYPPKKRVKDEPVNYDSRDKCT